MALQLSVLAACAGDSKHSAVSFTQDWSFASGAMKSSSVTAGPRWNRRYFDLSLMRKPPGGDVDLQQLPVHGFNVQREAT